MEVSEEKLRNENSHQNIIKVNDNIPYIMGKKVVDVLGAFIGLVITGIIFIIVGILIKVEDPKGSIFFTQIRVGKDGKEFKMYKFRSMVSDAEEKLDQLLKYNETTGALFKMKNDPRITRIGRIIRKTSIDELPQLWNVLKGDMSLVGPRPSLPREVNDYSEYDRQRLSVTPGCTGLWQISGRSNLGFNEMVELDLKYIKARSVLMDLKIIIKTFWVLFGSNDAY